MQAASSSMTTPEQAGADGVDFDDSQSESMESNHELADDSDVDVLVPLINASTPYPQVDNPLVSKSPLNRIQFEVRRHSAWQHYILEHFYQLQMCITSKMPCACSNAGFHCFRLGVARVAAQRGHESWQEAWLCRVTHGTVDWPTISVGAF